MRQYHVYIMASRQRRLYIGSTSSLMRRVCQHKHGWFEGFTERYQIDRLVHFEATRDAHAAVAREREVKSWRRERKVRLIETANAGWRDLSVDWFREPRGSSQD